MSTAIVYYSQHHGNTKKLLDAIKEYDPEIKLIDTTKTKVEDLSPYDRIGIASGIYFGKFNKDLTEYIKKINDLERVKNEQDLRNLRAKHQKEQEEAQMQISLLSDENFRLSMKLEDAHEEAKKQAEEAKKQVEEEKKAAEPAMPSVAETTQDHPGHETGIFARQRMNREEKRREAFITSVLGNGAFSKEQLTVINRVVSKKFSLSQLQKICDPKVKPENMELLEAYYERRQTSERL